MTRRTQHRKAAEPGRRAALDRVEGCLEVLGRHMLVAGAKLLQPTRVGEDRPGLELRLEVGGMELEYAVEVKRAVGTSAIGPLVHRARELLKRGQLLLVCAERIPDRCGEALREHGIAYLDLCGNAHLHAPGLYVLVAGRLPVKTNRTRPTLHGTEARLLGVFLTDPTAARAVQTELAERAGIALGAVGRAREALARHGILERTGKREWPMRDRALGLERFGEGWGAVVRPKLRPRTYRLLLTEERGDFEARLRAAGPELGCLLGGESAAAHLTRFLETEHATLHVPPGQQKAVAKALVLVPDTEGKITLLERYGRCDEAERTEVQGVCLAHPLLVWAECLTVPDERVAQAAARLREEHLERTDE